MSARINRARPFLLVTGLFCILGLLPHGSAALGGEEEPTVASVRSYLESQIPTEESRLEAGSWVRDLASDEFSIREMAEKKIMASPTPPVQELTRAAEDPDPELALRARRLLEWSKNRPRTNLHRALRWVQQNPDPSFVRLLLALSEFSKGSVERSLIHRALAESIGSGDIPVLKEYSKHEAPVVRATAVAGLAATEGGEATGVLSGMVNDAEESVKFAVASALVERADTRGLIPLGELLNSESSAIRMRAIHILRKATGEDFEFSAYSSEESRAKAARAIQNWISANGDTVKLKVNPGEIEFVGRTVVGAWPDSFHHLDIDGTALFTAGGFKYVWGCHGIPSGEFGVVDTKTRKAQVFDSAGKVIWEKDELPGTPSDIKLLDGGNKLITYSTPSMVVEYGPDGEKVWTKRFAHNSRATTAERLANGNTLVNLQFAKEVVEVDTDGKEVWRLGGLKNCLTAQALPNNNILVCEMNEGEVIEFNRAGDAVWKLDGFSNACQAQRLPNGNTLISDTRGIHEYDPAGNRVGHLAVKRGRFWRY